MTQPCKVEGCSRPKLRPYHRCAWHHLAIQPADVQAEASRRRLAMVPEPLRLRSVPAKAWPEGSRYCGGCASFVPLDYASGSRCKGCASASRHASRAEKIYGLSQDQHAALVAFQQGRCAVCGAKARSKRLSIDHRHSDGRVRGLLCSGKNSSGCNFALGLLHDDIELVRNLLIYLETPPAELLGIEATHIDQRG